MKFEKPQHLPIGQVLEADMMSRENSTTNLLGYNLLATTILIAVLVVGSFFVSKSAIHSQHTFAIYANAISALLESLQHTELNLLTESLDIAGKDEHSPKAHFHESLKIFATIRARDPDGEAQESTSPGKETKHVPQIHDTLSVQESDVQSIIEKFGLTDEMPDALAALWESEVNPLSQTNTGNNKDIANATTEPLEALIGRAIMVAAPIFLDKTSPEERADRVLQFETLMHARVEPQAREILAQLRTLTRESQAWSESVLLAVAIVGVAIVGFILFGIFRPLEKQVARDREKIQAARRKAEAADHAKSEFLANMSHEIRTPMNGVLGMAELLLMTEVNAVQKNYAQTILQSGNALLTIINDILDFSKINDGKLELDSAPFSLRSLVGDVTALVQPTTDAKGLEFTSRIHPKLPEQFVGDAGRLRQILVNFVGNAVKFTDEGHVTINITGTTDSNLSQIRIEVEDTGIGIPEDRLSAIFEKFNQVDNTGSREFEGTGLGLTICRMLVEKMGGSIQVESTLGHGSSFAFEIELPVYTGAGTDCTSVTKTSDTKLGASEKAIPSAFETEREFPRLGNSLEGDHSGHRVLVVEDNTVNQKVIGAFLESLNISFTIVENGHQALVFLDEHQPDLVFMDMSMPVMNGIDATAEIRRCEETTGRHTIVVGLTANAIKGDREKCIAAGMDDYLSKPIDLAKLDACLQTWLQPQEALLDEQAAG